MYNRFLSRSAVVVMLLGLFCALTACANAQTAVYVVPGSYSTSIPTYAGMDGIYYTYKETVQITVTNTAGVNLPVLVGVSDYLGNANLNNGSLYLTATLPYQNINSSGNTTLSWDLIWKTTSPSWPTGDHYQIVVAETRAFRLSVGTTGMLMSPNLGYTL